MKSEFLVAIRNIADLLIACDLDSEARWFQERELALGKLQPSSREFQKILKELEHILAGMGSFTDLRLHPKKGSGLTEREAAKRQWDLAQRLGELIQGVRKTKSRVSISKRKGDGS